MKKARVTVRDIAAVANVTPQTVSRAIRNAPEVSAETRERVLKIAAELNYVKNSTASSLRCGNSRLIVIIYDHLVNVYFSIMIDYLQGFFKAHNYSILMFSLAEHRLDSTAYKFAVSQGAVGIVSFLEPDAEVAALPDGFGIPILLFGRRTEFASVDYLRTDDEKGGKLAAGYLIGKGCRRAVYVSTPLAVTCAQDRYAGFCGEWARAGREQAPAVIEMTDGWERRFLALFGGEDAPDGVFCFSDMLAFDAVCLMEKSGIRNVPVVSFDNVQEEVRIPNRLVSVGTDKRAMAARAAEVLISRVENGRGERVTEDFDVFLHDNTDE